MLKKSIATLSLVFMVNSVVHTAQAAACGDIITSDVTLTSDLDCSTGYAALEVFAHNVTIDLNGYILSGTSSLAGVLMTGYNNLTVKNGSITGFYAGVNANQTNALNVNNITFYELGAGVTSNASNNATIEGNKFIRADTGISIRNATAKTSANANVINDNEFFSSRVGIHICGDQADSNKITNNLIWKTADYGIQLTQVDDTKIENNQILETDGSAIQLSNSSYSNISRNTLKQGRTGLSILSGASAPCFIKGSESSHKNNFSGNYTLEFGTGIELGLGQSSSANVLLNTLINNKVYDSVVGIYFESDAHNNTTSNGYQGTITPIIDNGVGNSY